jgi:hypothetical protein
LTKHQTPAWQRAGVFSSQGDLLMTNLPARNFRGVAGARRGGTLASWLVVLSMIGAFGVTAAMVTPRFLAGGEMPPRTTTASMPVHQRLIESLAALLGRSVAVVAIQDRGATPYEEAVLWLEDIENPGRIDPAELAVISHSRVLQTITYYGLDPDVSGDDVPTTAWMERFDLTGPEFAVRWRAHPSVVSRVLAVGVSDMQLERLGTAHRGSGLLRISLTWDSHSTDGADEASVLVEAALRREGFRSQ